MSHDDEPPGEELPIRFRPPIRFRQDPPALPEPLIRQVQDDEFTVLPDLLPVAPVVEAQENIAAMFEKGREEYERIKKLPTEYRTQFRRLTLRCRVRRCVLATVDQRKRESPRLVCLLTKSEFYRNNGGWQLMPPLAIPASQDGPEVAVRLRCRCYEKPISGATVGMLIKMAVHDPGTHPAP